MSLLEEEPFIRMQPDYDVDVQVNLIKLRQAMADGTTTELYCPQDDGRTRGRLEGFCRVRKVYDLKCVELLWTDADWFRNWEHVVAGRMIRILE